MVYVAGLVFSFRYNRDPLRAGLPPSKGPHVSIGAAMTVLAIGTVLTTVQAEVLVVALEPALKTLGMSELFAGVIVVALVGNAAEHYSAVSAARNNKMTLALEISRRQQRADRADGRAGAGPARRTRSARRCRWSSTPSKSPRSACRCWPSRWSSLDGESNWLEGLQLLGVYVILALAFFLIPG